MSDSTDVQLPVSKPRLSNTQYDNLKFIAQIVLPALGTLYFAIAGLWHLPYVTEIVGTITAVDVFLGILLGLSSSKYGKRVAAADDAIEEDGVLVVNDTDPNKDSYSFELKTPLDLVGTKKAIKLKVRKES